MDPLSSWDGSVSVALACKDVVQQNNVEIAGASFQSFSQVYLISDHSLGWVQQIVALF